MVTPAILAASDTVVPGSTSMELPDGWNTTLNFICHLMGKRIII